MISKNFKKFLTSLITTTIFGVLLYFLIIFYDKSGTAGLRINENLYYIVFVYISIIISLTIFGNNNKKGNFVIYFLFLINFLYIAFYFGISKVGINITLGYILLGLLILAFIGVFIKKVIGSIITIMSVLGIFIIFLSVFIPLYEDGPNVEYFETKFKPQLITYSNVNIKENKANIKINNKTYPINKGLNKYSFKISNSGSKIIFSSDKRYKNTFGFILFAKNNFVQLNPQSLIEINKDCSINIITGNVKFFPKEFKNFSITGKNIGSLTIDNEYIKKIEELYNKQIENYIKENIGGSIFVENKLIFNTSEFIVKTLNKIFPKSFENNIKNLNEYKKYLNIETQIKNYKEKINKENVTKNIFNNFIKSFNNTEKIN